jgi:large conductance mechanosensitive channel
VNSLVADLINPLLAAIVGKPDFSSLILNLHGGHIKYGNFMNAVIAFILNAGAVYFLFVLPFSTLLKRFAKPVVVPPSTRPCPECLSDIPLAATRCAHCAQPVPAVA